MILLHLVGTILMLFNQARHKVPSTSSQTSVSQHVLAEQTYSLTDRYKNQSVNTVFADNILLALSYMSGQTKTGQKVNWDLVHQPAQFQVVLQPGKTFAFHDLIMDTYKNSVVQTTNAHFSSDQGFKYDGWLVGDGVCHLASFINVVSSQAGLKVLAPTRHDFAAIPDVPKQFGTAIYYEPGQNSSSSRQNLYVTNTSNRTIALMFDHTQASVKITVDQL